ncbi:hypothetical protein HV436_13125 [Bacillus sporothermodurans]|uniref:amine dehydrogenase large subunit n=1 Tax=Heyndrickxia sporothermodurans TaxID=46224 RepID=UPI0013FE1569|nr:amine dehydrogenase large subunit [Heyndrickxia sporothermodurans]MBL5847188.1 hypothetical protein [Heyndrickxia sporothermodurans]MBL5850659.1 hypothetical protein [Heyndrickxia sporothermodurans]MBL5870502.1 hypothetical protein [Heyndrickxia sporothermodurans]
MHRLVEIIIHLISNNLFLNMHTSILNINNDELAVTNFSDKLAEGSKVVIVDSKTGKTLNSFETKHPVEKLSYIQQKFYTVDNTDNTISIYDNHGKELKTINAPTMVINFLLVH